MALEAAHVAISDANLDPSEIDGLAGVYCADHPTIAPGYVASGLGLDGIVWSTSTAPPSGAAVIEAANAIRAGACDIALCYHAKYRWDTTSASARGDPMRRSPPMTFDPQHSAPYVSHLGAIFPFAASMRRHMHEFGSRREHFGMLAVNSRSWAARNPSALFHNRPITLDDYLKSPLIGDPFCLLDMDAPCDVATAVVLASEERARDCGRPLVLMDSWACGVTGQTDQTFQPFDYHAANRVVLDRIWSRSGATIRDVQLANFYDGFTSIAMDWLEAAFGERGDGPAILEAAWDKEAGILNFPGGVLSSTHGGNLGEARTQGMGQVMEAIRQLRGEAKDRQIADIRAALATNAANPISCAILLRRG